MNQSTVEIIITKEKAQKLSHDLSDLLCWWQGYKSGINDNENLREFSGVAQHDIDAARDINTVLKNKLKN